jgi:hypothetical protein
MMDLLLNLSAYIVAAVLVVLANIADRTKHRP